jgi:Pyridine nucleotide-disulphide oxidoreductase
MQNYDVAVIGAGPYGLSASVHLRTIRGLQVRTFGKPMTFWEKNMPSGMFLRSPWEATHIAAPKRTLTLDAYVAACGNHLSKPIPLDRFIDYGRWFQKNGVADLDPRDINRIKRAKDGFQLTAEDGEILFSRRVVIAAGIAKFAWQPSGFENLPESLASHSCNQINLAGFSRKKVFVIGGGQSALESGALLHESGADVEIIVRKPQVHWLRWRSRLFHAKLVGRILYSPRDVGPAGMSQLTARPDILRLFPRNTQTWVDRRSIRPAGAAWLIDRLKDAPIRTNLYPKSATPTGKQVRVRFDDGSEQVADHMLFATGYRIDIAKYPFLSPELVSEIDQVNGYPQLKSGLESTAKGLHFLGAPAAWSFGPVTRFISGTYYCAQALTNKVAATQ